MDLANLQTLKSILAQYHIRPNKYLGQHFLVDREVLEEILTVAKISSEDFILEIGPGVGILTLKMAQRAKTVMAVEKDPILCQILQEILKTEKINNVIIVNQDILKISNFQYLISKQTQNTQYQIPDTKYKVVANLPYYLTTRLIRKFLEAPSPPSEMILMVQKEVAERICAQPPKMSLLAISVQFYAQPEIIAFISSKSFWPQPEVDSAIIKLKIKSKKQKNNEGQKIKTEKFFKVVKAGFSSPRKKITNNLKKILPGLTKKEINNLLQEISIRPNCRAQELTVDNWQKLISLLGKNII